MAVGLPNIVAPSLRQIHRQYNQPLGLQNSANPFQSFFHIQRRERHNTYDP